MKKNKKLLIILAIAVMAVLAGIIIVFSGSKKIKFKTAKIQKGEITQTVRATGNVNPVTTIIVGTRVSGTIVALYADYNSRIKKVSL